MALRDYIVQEVALDCEAGLLPRREALRRLGLLGVTAAAATVLLAACGDDGDASLLGRGSASDSRGRGDPLQRSERRADRRRRGGRLTPRRGAGDPREP